MKQSGFLYKSTALLPYTFFILAIGLVPILYQPYADFVKYALFIFAPIYLYLHQSRDNFYSNCRDLAHFLRPWSIWYIGIVTLILVHGVSGNSTLLNAFVMMCLLFLVLSTISFHREQVLWGISLNVILFSILILAYVFCYGLGSSVLGINKNRIIPEMTILGCVCFITFVFEREKYSKILRNTLLTATFFMLASIVVTEVRTALLGILAIGPLLLFSKNASSRKYFLVFCATLFVACTLFWMTGRLQEGLVDLTKYEAGNPNTSWGLRIEFWKLATAGFLEKPLLGWGYKPFHNLLASGFTFPVPSITKIPHFHSDYFTQLVSYGLVGITTWLITIFLLYKSSKNDPARLSIILSTLAMGVSDRIWHYNSTSILLIMFSWVLLYLSEKKITSKRV